MTLSNSLSPPVSNSSGMSNSSAGASRCSCEEALARRRAPRDGRSPRARRARRVAKDRAGSASRSSTPPCTVAGKALADRVDQSTARALQAARTIGVGIEHRHAGALEHLRDGRLAHADRAGERDRIMTAINPRSRSAPSSGSSGMPRMVKWSPSMRSKTIAPRGPPAGTRRRNSRPRAIRHRDRIAMKSSDSGAHVERRPCRHGASRPCRRGRGRPRWSAPSSCPRKAADARRPRRDRRLVEQPPIDADDAIAADHPVVRLRRLTASALASASSPAISSGSRQPRLDRSFVDIRRRPLR